MLLLAVTLLAMAVQEANKPKATGNADVREVGSQTVVGHNGEERTVPEKIIVDGEAFRVEASGSDHAHR